MGRYTLENEKKHAATRSIKNPSIKIPKKSTIYIISHFLKDFLQLCKLSNIKYKLKYSSSNFKSYFKLMEKTLLNTFLWSLYSDIVINRDTSINIETMKREKDRPINLHQSVKKDRVVTSNNKPDLVFLV